jgi:hypothetical protein
MIKSNVNNIFILFDCPDEKNDKKWLIDELSKLHTEGGVVSVSIHFVLSRLSRWGGILGKLMAYLIRICQAFRAVYMADKNDVLICWTPIQMVCVSVIMRKTKKNIKCISMNWLTPDNRSTDRTIKEKRSILLNNNIRIIVNSNESILAWRNFLQVDSYDNFRVIPDVFDDVTPFEKINVKDQKYCFSGGMNNRDWKLIYRLAEQNPNIQFVCVALKEDFENQISNIPSNMKVFYNTSAEEYYTLMKNSSIVLLPLRDRRVAGLINIIKSAQYGVPCLVSRTPATEQYYGDKSKNLLINNESQWDARLKKILFSEEEEYIELTSEFAEYIKENFSSSKAAYNIYQIINEM